MPEVEKDRSWPSPRRAWFAAGMLAAANTLAFVDRQALALLVEPIKQDLQVSDTAMSLLYGLSFTMFYVLVGLPVARLADKANRRNIVAAAVLIWSVATALCGVARSFVTLFIARIGVGAGEGGLSPAAYSLLADYFPKERLPAAMAVYQMGIYIGGAMALLLGGLLASVVPPSSVLVLPLLGAVKGWHLIFLALGAPGIVLALCMFLVREPVRMSAPGTGAADENTNTSPSLSELMAHMRRHWQAYFGISAGFALMILVGNATGAWIPAFLERKFGLTTAQIGAQYGLITALCGVGGTLAGGFIAAALRRRGYERANLFTAMFGFTALIPVTISFPQASTATLSLALIGVMNFLAGFNFGGGLAALQEITPNRMRASVSAGYMLMVNLIGAAGGPLAIAAVTDFWYNDPAQLPNAITIVCAIASPLSVLALLLGLRGYTGILKSTG
ncbi:MFS transporter [Novosphingobium sp. PP1Y]|uniref:spinster family MFS transporter n=1 Tax=Novosphingobium sp. PP1Y TaxID=702113 RepID=UPI00020EE73F|nr:MFS transporter [Novosphingobium sp. PP1Y]CCA91128.1 major facilitator superfamily MFS_1 [Novosphingobium sp. PP1Y]